MSSPARSWTLAALLALLVAGALVVRFTSSPRIVTEQRLHIQDPDTQRRLVRIAHLVNPADPYPYRNAWDGYPRGSVIHWTLPMDGVILGIDAVFSRAFPQARPFEAGAILAGPLLGALAVLAFALLAMRWMGTWAGLFAATFYAFSSTVIGITQFGNGDHQSLQHLCVLIALHVFAALVCARGGWRLALLGGLALGLGLWVSAETATVLQLMALGAFVHLLLAGAAERARAIRLHMVWALACLALASLGALLEHPHTFPAFTWDEISGFQLFQILVFVLFLGLLALWPRRFGATRLAAPLLSAAAALGAALALVLCTPLGTALGHQMDLFGEANRWVQNSVSEYRSLFYTKGSYHLRPAGDRFTVLIWLLPLWAAGMACTRRLSAAARWPLLLIAAGSFALTCFEVKLAHLFCLVYPVLIALGGGWWLERLLARFGAAARSRERARWIGALALLGVLALYLPPGARQVSSRQVVVERLMRAVRELEVPAGTDPSRCAVLALWGLGAPILYEGQKPVVASGYHRNLRGIHDSYRALLAGGWKEAGPYLREHRVRWILSWANLEILWEVGEILPQIGSLAELHGSTLNERGELVYDFSADMERIRRTLFWNLMVAPAEVLERQPAARDQPWFRLLPFESPPSPSVRAEDGRPAPIFRIIQVVYPEER